MDRQEFEKLTRDRITYLDGAFGSNMVKKGMPKNICVEAWLLDHKEWVTSLQEQYLEAGSQIIYAPTFSANCISLRKHGKEADTVKLNRELVDLTLENVKGRALVAGDLTTSGELLDPLGDLTEEELYEAYCQQIEALAQAGADLLVAETMLSLPETEVALRAALDTCQLPMICTLTVGEEGRALFGGTAAEAVETLQAQGASAVGVNCSVGPDQLQDVVKAMKARAKLPLVVKPNAGLPVTNEEGEAIYQMSPQDFAAHMADLVDLGANLIGGCCGTTPEYIRILREQMERR